MKYLRFVFTAAASAMLLWSCEKAKPEMSPEPIQEEFAVARKSSANVFDEMSRADETINSLLNEQLDDVSAVLTDIVAAPDNVFPSVEVKEGVVNLLSSIIPQDTTITRTLPFIYSNIDNTFGIMGELIAQLHLAVDEETGFHEVVPSKSSSCLAHFLTSSGDALSIYFADSKISGYESFKKSRSYGYTLSVEKNDSTVFEISSLDEKDNLPSIFLGTGLEFHHGHSGSLSISSIEILLDYDVDFAARKMGYNFAMTMPMFAEADTLLKVTGDFQQKGCGLTRWIESDQWFSMMDKGININVTSSDLRDMVGLMTRTLLKDESGYPEEFCKKLSDEWDTTATIMVYSGVEESGYIHLGYLPVNEDDLEPEFFVPALLVHLYEYFGEEFTIPEFIEMMEPMLPSISLPF